MEYLSVEKKALCSPETIWVCGKSSDGQLIIDNKDGTINSLTPINEREIFPFGDKIKWIGAGDHFTIFVTRSNVVYGAGQNSSGQLGLDHCDNLQGITRIPFFDHKHIVNISCGAYFSYFLEEIQDKQYLYVCGKNNNNPLGLGKIKESNVYPPRTVDLKFLGENDTIDKIVCGYESVLLLTKKGIVYGCGSNTTSQLGIKRGIMGGSISEFTKSTFMNWEEHEKIIDMSLGTSYSLLLSNLGNVYKNSHEGFKKIGSTFSPFEKIHFGSTNAFAKLAKENKHSGRIVTLSSLDTFELSEDIPETQEVISIAGVSAFFFITKEYQVYCSGYNSFYELGLPKDIVKDSTAIVRHYEMEEIIKNTRNLNDNIIPTIVTGFSHTILYFKSKESRDYLRFFSNLERHVYNDTILTDVIFNF
ncbi:hypothetical protein ABK040_002084 [Willaertia magna]